MYNFNLMCWTRMLFGRSRSPGVIMFPQPARNGLSTSLGNPKNQTGDHGELFPAGLILIVGMVHFTRFFLLNTLLGWAALLTSRERRTCRSALNRTLWQYAGPLLWRGVWALYATSVHGSFTLREDYGDMADTCIRCLRG